MDDTAPNRDSRWLDKLVDKSPVARIVAFAGELHFAGAKEDDKVGRTVKFDIRVMPEDAKLANPFGTYTRRRGGHAGSRFHASLNGVDNNFGWLDEVMLLNWGDGPKGQHVTFVISPQALRHPFMGITRGAQFMAALVEINDDEQIIDQGKRERVERAPQKLSNAAAQIIKTAHYREWVRAGGGTVDEMTADADAALKFGVGIQSKRELDHDPEAVKRFRAHMAEFEAWQKQKGYL